MTAPVLLVRLLPGLIGESRRVVHVVPLPAGGAVPELTGRSHLLRHSAMPCALRRGTAIGVRVAVLAQVRGVFAAIVFLMRAISSAARS